MNTLIFADGANINEIEILSRNSLVSGFTTNPSLMKLAGVKDYLAFCEKAHEIVHPAPISFEVFSDEINEMYKQAVRLSTIGDNIFVKIPITNTKGESTSNLSRTLNDEGLKLNITAIMTNLQLESYLENISFGAENIFSVFAGRIADTGIDPITIMKKAKETLETFPKSRLLWASPREILNLYQANELGVDIITLSPILIEKISLYGKDLTEYSLETVKMFYRDAQESNFNL